MGSQEGRFGKATLGKARNKKKTLKWPYFKAQGASWFNTIDARFYRVNYDITIDDYQAVQPQDDSRLTHIRFYRPCKKR